MQVRHDEGVAIRIDPEPCAAVRKASEVKRGYFVFLLPLTMQC